MKENNLLRKNLKTTIILISISLLILLPSFLLLATESWNSDDYYVAHLYQNEGLHGLSHRIFTWSPRIFSEIILYLYYNTVPWLEKQYAGVIILIFWLFLLSSIFIFSQKTISKNSLFLLEKKEALAENKGNNKTKNIYLKFLLPLLLTLILFTYFLYSNRSSPGSMYYLVIVSVAYLPTLVGIIFSLNFFLNQASSSRISNTNIFQLILFGVITSSSWEMGAVYQLFFSIGLFFLLLITSFSNRFNYLPFSRLTKFNRWKLSIANLINLSCSLYILFLLRASRLTIVEDTSLGSASARNFTASFLASISQLLKEIFFAREDMINFYSFTYSLVYKLSFFILLVILFYQAKVRLNPITKNACFLSIIPLFTISLIITFSAYYQLGTPPAQRQASFIIALIGLIIVIIALLLASLFSSQKNHIKAKNINIHVVMSSQITLLVSFCLTLILLIFFQFHNLKRDLFNFSNILISNNQSWQRSLDSRQSIAIYTQVPTYYIWRMSFEPGLYPACDHPDNGRPIRYINYFNKQKLYVTPFKDKALTDNEIKNQLNKVAQEMRSIKNKINFTCSFTPANAPLILGNVEQINQLKSLDQVIEVNIDETLEISGWVMNPDKNPPERIIITLKDDENLLVDNTVDIPRPDIAEYFGNHSLLNSGWKATLTPKPEWDGQTLTFKIWAYNPDTKTANFVKDFTVKFSSQKQNQP